MATPRQVAANRENAKKSTGPVTPEGKAKSCLNHLTPGFTRSNFMLRIENPEEFNALLSDLIEHFQPANIVEQILVEKMAQNQWLSLRAVTVQGLALMPSVAQGYIHKDLGVLVRYQHASDRAFHKAHAELLKAQKERKMSEIGFESKKAVKVAETPAESPQNPPSPPEKAHDHAFTAAPEAVFVPDIVTPAPKIATATANLPQPA